VGFVQGNPLCLGRGLNETVDLCLERFDPSAKLLRTGPSHRRTSVKTGGLSPLTLRAFFRVRTRTDRFLVFVALLTGSNVDIVSFPHFRKLKLVDVVAHVMGFVDEIENGFVVTIKITSDLGGRFRSYLFDDIEHLLEFKPVPTKDRVNEDIVIRLTVLTPVLLSVLLCRSSFDHVLTRSEDTSPSHPLRRNDDVQITAQVTEKISGQILYLFMTSQEFNINVDIMAY